MEEVKYKRHGHSLIGKVSNFEKYALELGETSRRMYNGDTYSIYRYGEQIKLVYFCYEHNRKSGRRKRKDEESLTTPEERFQSSLSRAKARIYELAACNEFDFFCTFTLDGEKVDRYDLAAFRKSFAHFIRNENARRLGDNKIRYLVIPEQHKDGAWHMHGLLSGLSGQLVKNKHGYLDWPRYAERYGFFNCSEIRDRQATAGYMVKYITKDIAATTRAAGEHLYFASQGLKGREVIARGNRGGLPEDLTFDYEGDYVKTAIIDEEMLAKILLKHYEFTF